MNGFMRKDHKMILNILNFKDILRYAMSSMVVIYVLESLTNAC